MVYDENRRCPRGGFPFSKPPPSASRPPHRARAKYTTRLDLRETDCPHFCPRNCPCRPSEPSRNGAAHAPGALIRMQRFFSPTTMPATDWRAPLYSHEPASTYLASRASGMPSARKSGARTGPTTSSGVLNRYLSRCPFATTRELSAGSVSAPRATPGPAARWEQQSGVFTGRRRWFDVSIPDTRYSIPAHRVQLSTEGDSMKARRSLIARR